MTLKELADANLKFGAALGTVLWNFSVNVAADAGIALPIWLAWNYVSLKLSYMEVFVLVWTFGVLVRAGTHHLKPKPKATILRYAHLNNHHYIYDCDPTALLHDMKVEATLKAAKLKPCSGSPTSQS